MTDIKIAGTKVLESSQSSAPLAPAAARGRPEPEVRDADCPKTFKGMMSIHESTLPSDRRCGHQHGLV